MDFSRRLLAWYARNKRDLPWRGVSDPYAVWISEVMLQQTTVNAVKPYYEKWMGLFPDIRALAAASLPKVLKAWQGLGYYQRARHLREAARILVAERGGCLPDDPAALRALPGFGPYTAAAVSSIAFGRPEPLIEANVRRVLMRVFGIEGRAEASRDKALLKHLAAFYPARRPGDFNQALMELGALVCRPKTPLCLLCPVRTGCAAFASGRQEVIPAPKARTYRRIEAVVGVIERDGRVLIQRRPADGLLGGLWEFPGGKVRLGESRRAALGRELHEELGVGTVQVRPLMTVDHSYTQFRVTLYAFDCALKGEPEADPRRRRWVRLARLRRYPFPSGSAKIVERILERQGMSLCGGAF